jgi:hypothetical protein
LRRSLAPFLLAAGLVAGVVVAPVSGPEQAQAATRRAAVQQPDATILRAIVRYRRRTWRWQRVMSVRLTPAARGGRALQAHAYRRWVRDLWRRRARVARRRAVNPPHKSAWLCIHRYEGAWSDPGGPYYGGLQMDIGFQQAYAPELLRRKGTAEHWSSLEQMWAGEHALRHGRGFWPWPNSARLCGLI